MSYFTSRRTSFQIVSTAVVLVSLIAALPLAGRVAELHVALKFMPTDTEEVLEKRGVVPAGGPPLEIWMALDSRPEPRSLLGQNREAGVVPVRTTDNVPLWITRTLTDTFRGWGTVSTPGASLVLQPDIVKLFVVEEHTYQAEAVMNVSLKRRDGTEIWSGTVGGSASRFGRSLRVDNYQEVISDAVFACYAKLWVDPGFRQAWRSAAAADVKPAPTPVPAPVKSASAETMRPEFARKRLLELREAGFDDASLAAWIGRVVFTRPFGAEDMIDLKNAGFPLSVIREAMSGPGESLEPAAAKVKAQELQDAGFDESFLVNWVKRVVFTKSLTSSDMIDWKSGGVSQAVIRAAME